MRRHKTTAISALLLALPALAAASAPTQPPTAEATRAMARLKLRYPGANAVWRPGLAGPAMLAGLQAHPEGSTDRARALAFAGTWRKLLGVGPRDLRFVAREPSRLRVTVRFGQTWRGLEVLDRYVAVVLDRHGQVLSVGSDAVKIGDLKPGNVGREAATEKAIRTVFGTREGAPTPQAGAAAREVIYATPGFARRAWRVTVVRAPLREHLEVLVDARSGEILRVRNLVRHG